MKIITISTTKGGSGKSTLCQALAVASGHAVIADMDPQYDSIYWSRLRAKLHPEWRQVPAAKTPTAADVEKLRRTSDAKYLFVDTPPAHTGTAELLKLFKMSDITLVPLAPSPKDIRSAKTVLDALRERQLPYSTIMMLTNPRATISGETVDHMKTKGYDVSPRSLVRRTAYPVTSAEGGTPYDRGDPKSQAEITSLWYWLLKRI